jgi:hypothetical protein
MLFRLSLAAALAATAVPSTACSVVRGYRIPSTLELTQRADAIVLARVEGGVAARPSARDERLTLAPILSLKGQSLPLRITMPGWLEAGPAKATPSDPAELAQANPDAFSGACNRYIFAKGMTLLLFLTKRDGEWQAISAPFARTAEDVPSLDARWVKAVREYVAIAALPKAARRARLVARRDLLRSKGDADSRAIAADMDRELAGPRKPLREPLPPMP